MKVKISRYIGKRQIFKYEKKTLKEFICEVQLLFTGRRIKKNGQREKSVEEKPEYSDENSPLKTRELTMTKKE